MNALIKGLKAWMCFFIVLLSCSSGVWAAQGEVIEKYAHDDWLIEKPSGKNGITESRLTIGGEDVFCIEPRIFVSDKPYMVQLQSLGQYLGISDQKVQKLGLIAWFGIHGSGREDEDWYAITQSLIWHELGEEIWILTPSTPAKADLEQCWDDILSDVDSFLIKPSIDGGVYDMHTGGVITLEDANGVLDDMEIVSAEGVDAEIAENSLVVRAGMNAPKQVVIELEKVLPEEAYRQNLLYGDNHGGQMVNRFGIESRVRAQVTINIEPLISFEFFKVSYTDTGDSQGEVSDSKDTEPSEGGCLQGATLRLTDQDGNVIDEWVTDDKAHSIQKLTVGQTYTLTEIRPADGYATAEPVTFTVKDTSDIQKIYMKDEPIIFDISKTDITNGEELSGASLKVLDEDGKVIDSWISEEKPHRMTGLIVGNTYTLVEEVPAPGYVTAEDIQFKVKDTGEVQTVEMKDEVTHIEIYKVDATTGENIENAVLEVCDQNDDIIARWETTSKPYELLHLVVGETYTLKEVEAPEGYTKADDMVFKVADHAEVQKVVMTDMPQKIVPNAVATGDDFNWHIPLGILSVSLITAVCILFLKNRLRH